MREKSPMKVRDGPVWARRHRSAAPRFVQGRPALLQTGIGAIAFAPGPPVRESGSRPARRGSLARRRLAVEARVAVALCLFGFRSARTKAAPVLQTRHFPLTPVSHRQP